MRKRLTSFILALTLSFSLSLSAFAVDDMDYYSLPPVGGSEPSLAVDWPVNPAEFSNDDSRTLSRIFEIIQYLYLSPASWQRNSVIGFLERILDAIPSNLSTNFALQGGDGTNAILDGIRGWVMQIYNYLSSDNIAGNLGNIQRNTGASADRLLSLVQAVSGIHGFATESSLSKLVGTFSTPKYDIGPRLADFGELIHSAFGAYSDWFVIPGVSGQRRVGFNAVVSNLGWGLTTDSKNLYNDGKTLYHYVKNLSATLASEDDKQLAENYKENREQAEQDFLSGKSDKTSLGKGDFHNASQVGGALNDTFNMGGAASVSDFLAGFGSAGSESQAWFSQTTANNLNAVEAGDGTQGVSTFSDDGETMVDADPDPYNMGDIFSRYDWLEGVIMDD
nr:MAG TPA: hypothetical protein [Inoviridae sp.]